ncbi:hypothetical protein SMQE08_14330 [Serratia marcescens]|nr:hypothetical protein SMQE08_14330 [Serratia marcescens]
MDKFTMFGFMALGGQHQESLVKIYLAPIFFQQTTGKQFHLVMRF